MKHIKITCDLCFDTIGDDRGIREHYVVAPASGNQMRIGAFMLKIVHVCQGCIRNWQAELERRAEK